jgi:hypothetical protein
MGHSFSGQSRLLLAGLTVVVATFSACGSSNRSVGGTGTGGASSTTGSGGTGDGGIGSGGSSSGSTGSSSGGITITTSTMPGADAGDGGCSMNTTGSCTTNAQCNDGDPNTTDTCIITDPGSEVPTGTCVHTTCDGGVNCAVDSTCNLADAGSVYPPYVPLYAPDVPATCANGFEICDAEGAPVYTIHALTPSGSRALTLDLDFATYLAPDGLLITGIDGDCQEYVLFDSCRLQTADESESDYTNGMERPSDIAIRQFHLTLRQGTSQLTFDFSRVVSPMYFQILGLCDFSLPTAPGVGWFNLVQ